LVIIWYLVLVICDFIFKPFYYIILIMDKKYYLLILLGLGLATHFIFFSHPNQTVFDEVHFGKFISGYYTREYFFDIHPPLGKMAIAGFAKLFDFKPGFAFAEIGNEYPDKQYLILRFLPNLAGSLLPIVIFLLLLEMSLSLRASFFGGLFIILENALLTQSHYILLDSFLLIFGFLALLFYFRSKNLMPKAHNLLLFGLFSGLAISVKWTGLSFLALPLAFEAWRILKNRSFKNIAKHFLLPIVVAVGIYFIFFTGHLIILNKSGPGDAFMSIGFQKTLAGSKYENDLADSPNLLQKFTELNMEMYKANQNLTATHPYSSEWYSWPLMTRPIYYWVDGDSRIYLIGNHVIWWASSAAILFSIILLLSEKLKVKSEKILRDKFILHFLLAGYVINILPFIGVKRVMFLYHYFTAYIFAVMILTYLLDNTKYKNRVFAGLLIASVVAFIYFAPLSYGLELPPKAYEARVWLESWK